MPMLDHSVDNPFGCSLRLLCLSVCVHLVYFVFHMFFAANIEHATARRMEDGNTKWWPPPVEFIHPLFQNCGWRDHDDRLTQLPTVVKRRHEGNDLDGFPKAHFIPDNTADLLTIQFPEPLYAS